MSNRGAIVRELQSPSTTGALKAELVGFHVGLDVRFLGLPDTHQARWVNSLDAKCRECRVSVEVESPEENRRVDSMLAYPYSMRCRAASNLDSNWTPKKGFGKVCWL